jgi:hypothetical protein
MQPVVPTCASSVITISTTFYVARGLVYVYVHLLRVHISGEWIVVCPSVDMIG